MENWSINYHACEEGQNGCHRQKDPRRRAGRRFAIGRGNRAAGWSFLDSLLEAPPTPGG